MSSINLKEYASTPSRKTAFIGLGVMGYPMAGHLAQAGHEVTVYNRTAAFPIYPPLGGFFLSHSCAISEANELQSPP